MLQALTVWVLGKLDKLPNWIGWTLFFTGLAAGAWAYNRELGGIKATTAELAKSDVRQQEQFAQVLRSVDQLVAEMKLYREAREQEVRELRLQARGRH